MRFWTTRLLTAAAVAAVTAGLAAATLAQDDAEAVIEYRQSVMNAQAGHVGAVSRVARGQVDLMEHVVDHADALQSTAAMIPAIFPEGSTGGDSDALPAIWENWDGFVQAADRLEQAAADLRRAAEAGDRAGVAQGFAAVGQACSGCHNDYRAE
jgi:cytochrome c556